MNDETKGGDDFGGDFNGEFLEKVIEMLIENETPQSGYDTSVFKLEVKNDVISQEFENIFEDLDRILSEHGFSSIDFDITKLLGNGKNVDENVGVKNIDGKNEVGSSRALLLDYVSQKWKEFVHNKTVQKEKIQAEFDRMLKNIEQDIINNDFNEAFLGFDYAIIFYNMPMHKGFISEESVQKLDKYADALLNKIGSRCDKIKHNSYSMVNDLEEKKIEKRKESLRYLTQALFKNEIAKFAEAIKKGEHLKARKHMEELSEFIDSMKDNDCSVSKKLLDCFLLLSVAFASEWNSLKKGDGFVIEDDISVFQNKEYDMPDEEGYIYLRGYSTDSNVFYGKYIKVAKFDHDDNFDDDRHFDDCVSDEYDEENGFVDEYNEDEEYDEDEYSDDDELEEDEYFDSDEEDEYLDDDFCDELEDKIGYDERTGMFYRKDSVENNGKTDKLSFGDKNNNKDDDEDNDEYLENENDENDDEEYLGNKDEYSDEDELENEIFDPYYRNFGYDGNKDFEKTGLTQKSKFNDFAERYWARKYNELFKEKEKNNKEETLKNNNKNNCEDAIRKNETENKNGEKVEKNDGQKNKFDNDFDD